MLMRRWLPLLLIALAWPALAQSMPAATPCPRQAEKDTERMNRIAKYGTTVVLENNASSHRANELRVALTGTFSKVLIEEMPPSV